MKPIVLLLSVLLFNGCVVFCHKERFRYADVEMVVHEGALSALNESHFICYDFQKKVSQDRPKKGYDYWTWIDLNWDWNWKSECHGAAVFQEGIWKHYTEGSDPLALSAGYRIGIWSAQWNFPAGRIFP